HVAVGLATGFITLVGLTGIAPLPAEAGLGRWAVGLPLLAFGQSAAGLAFLLRRPGAPLSTFRFVEVSQFAMIALVGGIGRFVVLHAAPAESPDPRYHDLLYRFDAIVSNYPLVFAVILYGVVIPNTRRRSLIGVALLVMVPVFATTLAAATNPAVRPALPEILPGSAVPLFMA